MREFDSKFANLAKFACLVQIREFGRIPNFANLKNEFATMSRIKIAIYNADFSICEMTMAS